MEEAYKNHKWRPTKVPKDPSVSRTDDIWFADEHVGWAVNSNGCILATKDGGDNWVRQAHFEGTYLRCVGFAGDQIGWVGTFNPDMRLLHTRDGGATWSNVANLPGPNPQWICGLHVVNEKIVYAAGSNNQLHRATILKTVDGGANWQLIDMDAHAASLIDIFFHDENSGWVVGGVDTVKHPNRPAERGDLVPGIFRTLDGGATWKNLVVGPRYVQQRGGLFPQGEWCWKIQILEGQTIVVSNQNYRDGAILRSDDGGVTWERLRLNDRQRNSNLEGIGFLDSRRGWVGGWGDLRYQGGYTSETTDGGANWTEANHVGSRLNRFRPIGSPPTVVYASGDTVYKFSDDPVPPEALIDPALDAGRVEVSGSDSVAPTIDVPVGTARLTVRIWDCFGQFVRMLLDEDSPESGSRKLNWDFTNDKGFREEAGAFIMRVTMDGSSQSLLIFRRA